MTQGSNPRLMSPALAARFFTASATWETPESITKVLVSQFVLGCFSCFSHVQLFLTLWPVAHQAPVPMGFSRQDYWCGFPCSPPGDLPYPEVKLESLMSPALEGRFSTTSTTWETPNSYSKFNS